jgi:DUF4097 and DUF4098 domain-containing protein YvlB
MTRLALLSLHSARRVVGTAVFTIAVIGPRPAAAQSFAGGAADTVFIVERGSVVDITLRTGHLVVRGTDRREAELRAGGTGFLLRRSAAGMTINVGNEFRGNMGRRSKNDSEDIELLVPRSMKVIVRGAATDVDVLDINGDVEVSVISGDVALRAVGGRAIVETVSGNIEVVGGVGDFRATSVSGEISARLVRGDIDVNTVSGEVVLSAVKARRVSVKASAGGITFDSALPDDAEWELTAHSGDIQLQLPANASGQLEVSTFNGDVSGGAMTLMPSSGQSSQRGGRAVQRFEFGGGGTARIRASTFNGDISIVRSARRGSLE